jgi:hypothetical protein
MKKRIRMEKAKAARQKFAELPDIPPYLEEGLAAAKREFDDFLADYPRQSLKWGLSASFDDIVRPYKERVDIAMQRIRDYWDKPETYLTSRLASLSMKEFGQIILSEYQSRAGRRPRDSECKSNDGTRWDSERIAEAARRRGYESSDCKADIVSELASKSGKSETTVRRALREKGVSRPNKSKNSR